MRGRYQTVEVDIHDFDDDAILEAAAAIRRDKPGGGTITPEGEDAFYAIAKLAAAIASGDSMNALSALDDLVGADSHLREAVDIGRRRRL